MSSMDKDLSKRVKGNEKRELRAERMQASASGSSVDLETDDSVVSLQVASVLAPDLETWRSGLEADDSVVSLHVASVRASDLETDD